VAIASNVRWIGQHEEHEEEETLTADETMDAGRFSNPATRAAANRDPRLNGWEYKIVRASRKVFRDPAVFKKLCTEEEQAGWVLFEKLDDRRVRFKRPLALRALVQAERLTFDPYRTEYREASSWRRIPIAIAFLAALILPAYLGYAFVAQILTKSTVQPTAQPTVTPLESPPATSPGSPSAPPSPIPDSPQP
jgi:hypothetical protein